MTKQELVKEMQAFEELHNDLFSKVVNSKLFPEDLQQELLGLADHMADVYFLFEYNIKTETIGPVE